MKPSLHKCERGLTAKGSALQLLILAPVAAFLSCAGQVAPSGGPPDRVPPVVVRTVPDTNAVRVSTNSIVLEFDEYVDRRTVEESIFISPDLGDLEFEWSGREVAVHFAQPLRPHTTYVVNVGTDVVDLRERTRMASGYTLAFSSGDSIDQGSIAGQVVDDRPEGVMIFAYQLDRIAEDTLNPAQAKPDFIMQTGERGMYRLSNLPMGRFRVFAVRDEYRNLIYDREVDQIGMAPRDIALDAGGAHAQGISFRLSKEDTTRPFVTGAAAPHNLEVDVRLNESLDSTRLGSLSVTVSDTVRGAEIPLLASFWKQSQPPTLGLLLGAPLDSAGAYRVHLAGVFDREGNPLNAASASAVFEGSGRIDTGLVRVSAVRDSTRGIRPEAPLVLELSEPVRPEPLQKGVLLLDSLSRAVRCSTHWEGPSRLVLHPKTPLWSSAWYTLEVRLDSVQDLRGRRYADSVSRVRFQTLDLKRTGVITGTLVDSAGSAHPYLVIAESIDLAQKERRTVRCARPGPFALRDVIEGKYILSAFEDADGNGVYTVGTPSPYRPAERFAVGGDTLRVRARWSIEGALLRFR
jgi:hypothetical protein